ncbi:hypothetical protein RHSIM_RhsimUnG0005600 [Rhododendron simsii]|uniref:Glycerol-3-phosphate dehydrogenase NAD-dependent N-terminal domain-containing protein n=1 Tax=Rhododendron simsii TaxID=118357 RepID=A0A834FX85_RHOSS|nr:hypothetical protein RHSIM_RhsimUnG0005600 [Rhododendron simsii]
MSPSAETASGDDLEVPNNKSRVTVVGSGNWGSVAAKLIASNTLKLSSFHGISTDTSTPCENVKYLPGIKLGRNVVAVPDLEHAVRDANMLVFVAPHQLMEGLCRRLVGKIRADAEAISLIKGMEVKMEGCLDSKRSLRGVKTSRMVRVVPTLHDSA